MLRVGIIGCGSIFTEPFISGKEAFKIQKLICAIYESAKSGKTVFFEK